MSFMVSFRCSDFSGRRLLPAHPVTYRAVALQCRPEWSYFAIVPSILVVAGRRRRGWLMIFSKKISLRSLIYMALLCSALGRRLGRILGRRLGRHVGVVAHPTVGSLGMAVVPEDHQIVTLPTSKTRRYHCLYVLARRVERKPCLRFPSTKTGHCCNTQWPSARDLGAWQDRPGLVMSAPRGHA